MVRHGGFHFHFTHGRFFILHLLHLHHIFVHFVHHHIFVHHIVHWHFIVHRHHMIVHWWRRRGCWLGRIGGGYVMMGFGGRRGDIVWVVSHVFDVRMVGIVIRIVRVICQYHNGQ